MISPLIEDSLLRSVRSEIQEHLSFTEKETDIYKIFQSGDLANLDGLDDASLSRLPSLLKLRDALYSQPFREFLSEVTGSGKLSGRKTDMAINVYTEGCHLLCHDDVIGSRRVSYILYLTDPDEPWKPEYGGALRLYPTRTETDADGKEIKIPGPDWTVSIPPAFNQLSFFTVQPGESFHDVEEVYHAETEAEKGKKRVRMAISGWFHIPQEGEDGFEEGLEEKLAERSSLQQLQGRHDEFDLPQPQVTPYKAPEPEDPKGKGKGKAVDSDEDEKEFTEEDFEFLLKYIAPSYLTPDVIEQMSESFENEPSLRLEQFLNDMFSTRLRSYIEEQEKESNALPKKAEDIEKQTDWKVSRPPHKHRYLFQKPRQNLAPSDAEFKNPLQELIEDLLPSRPFKKWLSVATGTDELLTYNLLARRFRRGQDYTLASGYDGDAPRLEFTIGLTPSSGWEKADDEDEDEEENEEATANGSSSSAAANGRKPEPETKPEPAAEEEPSVGGYEIYMAGDEDEDSDDEEHEHHEGKPQDLSTGGANPKVVKAKKAKLDPAIYRASEDDEDDGILFSMGAGWNRMSIVLRDRGTLKFVKYVSRKAQGDRWDVTGEVEVRFDEEGEEE